MQIAFAWLLVANAFSAYTETAVPGIASQQECVRLAHAMGQTEGHGWINPTGPTYQCLRYQIAK